jgi:hypothetical protein
VSKVQPGQAYEAKEFDRGLYVTLGRNWRGQRRCVVLLSDRLNPSERPGEVVAINESWLLQSCWRIL